MTKQISLDKRLGAIAQLITLKNQYDQVWDCCCDHGYLGAYLLEQSNFVSNKIIHINFVDQVAHITDMLQQKLSQSPYSDNSNYRVLTLDAKEIELVPFDKHCIVIAGVTTAGTLNILQAIVQNHPEQALDFILCPTRGQYELRQYLIKHHAMLLSERLVLENQRFYEILHIRLNNAQCSPNEANKNAVTEIGEFWNVSDHTHHNYALKKIEHYQRESAGKAKPFPSKALKRYLDKAAEYEVYSQKK